MPNTYSQILLQIVFTVHGRQNLISEEHRNELERYITGIITKRGQKLLAIFCMPDHVHIVIGLKPSMSISDLVRDIKTGSSNFINDSKWVRGRFNWQEGFGVFSYSKPQLEDVVGYVLNQKEHHQENSFKQEYLGLLKQFEIDYDDRYLFDFDNED